MLIYVTGVPGAGKTYYAVYKIYELKNKYNFIYTNVHLKQYEDNIKKFDFDNFYSIISSAYQMYINKCIDDDINAFLETQNFHKVLFVIDEVHNFFNKKDDVLIWFLTYHRHLYIDLYFITQSLDLVERKYLSLGEVFIKAVQSSLRIAPKFFFYNKYPNYKMQEKFETEKLPKKKEIFEKYTSGDVVRSKNVFLRFFILLTIFFIISIIFFLILKYVFLSPHKTHSHTHTTINYDKNVTFITNKTYISHKIFNNSNNSKKILYVFYCPNNYCYIKNNKFSLNFLYFLIKKYKITDYYISSPYLYILTNLELLRPFSTVVDVCGARGRGGVSAVPSAVENAVQ